MQALNQWRSRNTLLISKSKALYVRSLPKKNNWVLIKNAIQITIDN